jgi:putative endonuclease
MSGENERLYVDTTSDLKQRLALHKSGNVNFTKKFDKLKLIYCEVCLDKADARKRELQLKTGFGRGYIKKRLENYFKMRV